MATHAFGSVARILGTLTRVFGALTLLFALAACADKAVVADATTGSAAHLGVGVALGSLAADGDITAVRVVARYTPLTGSDVVLADQTIPYVQGDTRDVSLTLDLAACLSSYPGVAGATPVCPVRVTVEVLAAARVLARDVLPVVQVRAGQTTSTPALAARSATAVRIAFAGVVAPATIGLVLGKSGTLTAEALDVGASPIAGRVITWTSSTPAVATVTSAGVLTTVGVGSSTITATTGSGAALIQSSTVLTVSAPVPASVAITPASASISVGSTQALSASVSDAGGVAITPTPTLTWSSADATIATVSAAGVVTGIAAGSTVISARTANNIVGSAALTVVAVPASVTLTPSATSLVIGGTATLVPTVKDAAGATIAPLPVLTWTTGNAAVATVSAVGTVTAVSAGSAVITATTPNGIAGTATIAVASVPATLLLTPSTAALGVGATQTLTATVRDSAGVTISPLPVLTWSSTNAAVATVSSSGVVTAVAAGSSVISARTGNGITGSATITVTSVPATVVLTPATANVTIGATQSFTAVVRDAIGAAITPLPTLTWSSANAVVATVSQNGVVSALTPGSVVISARTNNGIVGTASITVSAVPVSIVLTPSASTLSPGGTQALVASVRDGAGVEILPTPPLTWTTNGPTVASVSSTGVVTALAIGPAVILARAANGIQGSATITVAATGSLSGRVYDFETNVGIAGATIVVSRDGIPLRTVTADGQGAYVTGSVLGNSFDLRASATGYVSADIIAVRNNGGASTIDALPLVKAGVGNGVVSGRILGATTNQSIGAVATVDLYAGANATTGTIIATSTTNTDGTYTFNAVPAGTYTIVARATGYTSASRTVVSLGIGRSAGFQNLFLAPTAGVGSLRIVLSWGATPADLDSHLTGPGPNASTFWINFSNRGSCTVSPFACLDIDVVDGRGPETMTIAQRVTGRYVYSVHNYSAGNAPGDGSLSQSNARVDVYSSTGLLTSFSVPALPGTLWTVFDWDGSVIRPINTISGLAPPGTSAGISARFQAAPLPVKVRKR